MLVDARMTIRCQHVFCLACCEKLLASAATASCPLCREYDALNSLLPVPGSLVRSFAGCAATNLIFSWLFFFVCRLRANETQTNGRAGFPPMRIGAAFSQVINDLRVRCEFHRAGCRAEITLGDKYSHEKDCAHRTSVCQHRRVRVSVGATVSRV